MPEKRKLQCVDCEYTWESGAETPKCPKCQSVNLEEVPEDAPEDNVDDSITVPQSKISTQGFRHAEDPEKVEKEAKRHAGFVKARTENRKKKIKEAAKKSPVEVRRDYLRAKLAIVRDKTLTHHYTREQVQVMIKELDIINNSPETWKHGCVRAKKARSVDDKLEAVMADRIVSPTS